MNNNPNFSTAADLISMHIKVTTMLIDDELRNLSNEKQQNKFMAFELGVIEYFFQTMVSSHNDKDSDAVFFNFLIHCAKALETDHYAKQSLFTMWKEMAVNGLYFEERGLGFDSVNNDTNPDGSKREGHFPTSYLMKAVGLNEDKKKPSKIKLVSKKINVQSEKLESSMQKAESRTLIKATEYARISGKELQTIIFELMTDKADGTKQGDDWYIYIAENDPLLVQLKIQKENAKINWRVIWGAGFLVMVLMKACTVMH